MTGFALFSLACKSSLILGIVSLMSFMAGRRWPSSCSIWARVGIVTLFILPGAVSFFPTIAIPVLPNVLVSKWTQPPSTIDLAGPSSRISHSPEPMATESLSGLQPVLTGVSGVDPISRVTRTASGEMSSMKLYLILTFAVGYACIASVLLIRFVVALRRLQKLRASASTLTDPEWLKQAAKWTRLLKIPQDVEVRVTDAVPVPLTFGWRSPVIVIPRGCLASSDSTRIEAILVHELTHIANSDFFWKALTQLMVAMYWAHPLAWLVRRDGDILRERLCDQVCSQQLGRKTYATALIEIAKRITSFSETGPNCGLGIAMAQRSSIRRRLKDLASLKASSCERSGKTRKIVVVVMAAMTLGLVMVGMLTVRVPRSDRLTVQDSIRVQPTPKSEMKQASSNLGRESDLEMPLADVVIEGNSTIPRQVISKIIKTRARRVVNRDQIRDDVDALVRTRWFSSVEPLFRRTEDGIVLVYHVLERPVVSRVEYRGNNRVKQKVLDSMTQLKPGSPFDVSSNRECAHRIEEYYHEKGFAFATVDLVRGADPYNREVEFLISEGPKVAVASIQDNDRNQIDDGIPGSKERNKTKILSLSAGRHDPNTYASDVAAAKHYYHRLGYFDAEIKHNLKFSEDRSKVEIDYRVDEGPRYKIRNIEFAGNKVLSEVELRGMMKVAEGQYYNSRDLNQDVSAIRQVYAKQHRLFHRVDAIPRWTEESGLIDIVYKIEEDVVYSDRDLSERIKAIETQEHKVPSTPESTK